MSNELSVTIESGLTLKQGQKLRTVTVETALVVGGKHVADQLRTVGHILALKKASNGNFGAAVEIVSLAAVPAAIKFLAPPEGQAWKKGAVVTLCEKTLERSSGAKGYTGKQLQGRAMAHALLKLFNAPKAASGDDAALENPQE